ncbi:MAG TPA: aminomethyl-transferring glycine dehydrogenase subunit GcvPA [Polyangia bacterium]|jgi:glycine dehydrogenase subunit 1|nr:aminomethyl-transferring glycine dehydrogenase subunit GcvPA [Polyangia bacterium]HWE29495.1 aminomethyl-transferring glycine dehydrogenase subunit GcvPA [Polyangia bacterium]
MSDTSSRSRQRYIPHTDDDIERMLGVVGKPSVESLFAHIPARLRSTRPLDIAALDENSLLKHLGDIGGMNKPAIGATYRDGAALSFLGGGVTPHTIPSAVDMLLQRSEWYTSYTPYQPEISQGTLQAIFEFQTIVSELFGLDVANASMYDGASAAAEAVLMARRVTGRRHAIVAGAIHPHYTQTIDSYLAGEEAGSHEDFGSIGFGADGRVSLQAIEAALAKSEDIACVVVQTPNFFGVVEDLPALAALAHARGALLVVANTEPVAFGILSSPGALGADIVVGEGLGLAIPPTMGGPGVGLFAAKPEHMRQLPGRLVGETTDRDGQRGYVLTLATREQHIRREKATSNICTNQGLIALAFTIHMALLGKRGLREMAELNLAKSEYAKQQIAKLAGFSLAFTGPTFNEFAVRVRGGDANVTVEKLADQGIYAGVAATMPGMLPKGTHDDVMIIAVTERHSQADIDKLASALDWVLS